MVMVNFDGKMSLLQKQQWRNGAGSMDFAIYYTLGAIVLYGVTDWLLNRIEEMRGKRFAQRNIIFFVILFVLAMILMNIINPPQQLPDPEVSTPKQ
jgi:uncharacterized PurR-regulated membrane protein YhhQ (DUF165 family)